MVEYSFITIFVKLWYLSDVRIWNLIAKNRALRLLYRVYLRSIRCYYNSCILRSRNLENSNSLTRFSNVMEVHVCSMFVFWPSQTNQIINVSFFPYYDILQILTLTSTRQVRLVRWGCSLLLGPWSYLYLFF